MADGADKNDPLLGKTTQQEGGYEPTQFPPAGGGGETTDATKPNATDDLLSGRLTGDAHNRIEIDADGTIRLGPGSALPGGAISLLDNRVAFGLGGVRFGTGNSKVAHLSYGQNQDHVLTGGANQFQALIVRPTSIEGSNTPGLLVNPTGLPTKIPLAVKGAASQTANLQEWQDSAGEVKASVNAAGNISVPNNLTIPSGGSIQRAVGSNIIQIQPASAGLAFEAHGNYTRLLRGGATAVDIDTNGILLHTGGSTRSVVVKGAAAQTGNLQEWQDSAGATLASVGAGGTAGLPVGSLTNVSIQPQGDPDTGVSLDFGGSNKVRLVAGGNVVVHAETGAGPELGFFGANPVVKPTGVAVTAEAIHAALVSLGLIAA